MALLIRCPTEEAILLASFVDDIGVHRFLSQSQDIPGIRLKPRPGAALHDELLLALRTHVAQMGLPTHTLGLSLNHSFEDVLEIPEQLPLTLYLGQISTVPLPAKDLPTMPDLLRGMAKTRMRLPYMRALQHLSIGLKDDLTAVETDKLPF